MSSLLYGDLMVLETEPSTTVNAPIRRPLSIAEPNSTGVRLDLAGQRALYSEVRELLRAFRARDEVKILSLFYGKSTYLQEKIIKAFDLLPENRWGAQKAQRTKTFSGRRETLSLEAQVLLKFYIDNREGHLEDVDRLYFFLEGSLKTPLRHLYRLAKTYGAEEFAALKTSYEEKFSKSLESSFEKKLSDKEQGRFYEILESVKLGDQTRKQLFCMHQRQTSLKCSDDHALLLRKAKKRFYRKRDLGVWAALQQTLLQTLSNNDLYLAHLFFELDKLLVEAHGEITSLRFQNHGRRLSSKDVEAKMAAHLDRVVERYKDFLCLVTAHKADSTLKRERLETLSLFALSALLVACRARATPAVLDLADALGGLIGAGLRQILQADSKKNVVPLNMPQEVYEK